MVFKDKSTLTLVSTSDADDVDVEAKKISLIFMTNPHRSIMKHLRATYRSMSFYVERIKMPKRGGVELG